jgi:hypothetical protein
MEIEVALIAGILIGLMIGLAEYLLRNRSWTGFDHHLALKLSTEPPTERVRTVKFYARFGVPFSVLASSVRLTR